MASSSIRAGPELGTVGKHVAHAFVGDVEADRRGMWSAVTDAHPRGAGQRKPEK